MADMSDKLMLHLDLPDMNLDPAFIDNSASPSSFKTFPYPVSAPRTDTA